jgi:hypothetical protein
VTAQWLGKASRAMNKIFPGPTTNDRFVPAKARASIRINCESLSNEIDESDLQDEKHDEQRIRT